MASTARAQTRAHLERKGCAHKRNSDYYEPLLKGQDPCSDAEEKRKPLTVAERTAAARERAEQRDEGGPAAAGEGVGAPGQAAAGTEVVGQGASPVLEGDLWLELFAWIDTLYPDDKLRAVKLKVAFKKEHIETVRSMCLEDVEEVCATLQAQ